MLTVEAIVVLGLVYLFFMVATLRATRAEEKESKKASRPVPRISRRALPEA